MCTSFTSEFGDTSLRPYRAWQAPPWETRARRYEPTLLPDARFAGRCRVDCRIQALPRENLAGDDRRHQGSRNRGPGDLSPWNTNVHDHGRWREFFVGLKSRGGWEDSESTGRGGPEV